VKHMCVGLVCAALLILGCATTGVTNAPGRPTRVEDPSSPGIVQGLGIESQDIVSMADQMVRDIMATPALASRSVAPRVIVDGQYFRNESSMPLDKSLITDRLRVELNRAATGKMVFVGRNYADMVEHERDLKEEGVVSGGTGVHAAKPSGADYRLGGSIRSLDQVDPRTGMRARYFQIVFEMIDLETSAIVWSNLYDVRKAGQSDAIYR